MAPERPQGVLRAFGQSDEALPAEHGMDVLKPGIAQPDAIEAMVELDARDRDTQFTHVGEVGQAELRVLGSGGR